MQAFDEGDVAITDEVLIRFLSESDGWLHSLQELNLKKCHYVTCHLLRFLRISCPSVKKLSPSRWTNPDALREIAAFGKLEVGIERCIVMYSLPACLLAFLMPDVHHNCIQLQH